MPITDQTLDTLMKAAEGVALRRTQRRTDRTKQARLKEAVAQAAVELGVVVLRPRVRAKDMNEFERLAYEFSYERTAHPSNRARPHDIVIFDNRGVSVEVGAFLTDGSFQAHG